MAATVTKHKVVKDYIKLDPSVQEQIKLEYPDGFEENLISFRNREGKMVSALPFETEEKYYLVRMTISEAQQIIEEDEDYDEDGSLKEETRVEYQEKHLEEEAEEEENDPYVDPDEEDE